MRTTIEYRNVANLNNKSLTASPIFVFVIISICCFQFHSTGLKLFLIRWLTNVSTNYWTMEHITVNSSITCWLTYQLFLENTAWAVLMTSVARSLRLVIIMIMYKSQAKSVSEISGSKHIKAHNIKQCIFHWLYTFLYCVENRNTN